MLGKITKTTVERLPLDAVLWDQSLVGFGARRQRRHVHYLLRYRLNGHQRFHTIGRHGMWTPDSARTEAKRLLGLVASKVDPASGRVRLADIDRRTIASRLAEIEQASGPGARNRVRSSLSAFFTFAIREGLLDVNTV